MPEELKCKRCGGGPFATVRGLDTHVRLKHTRAKRGGGPRAVPVQANYCYNCGCRQPKEVVL